MEALASIIVHELKQPLTAALAYVTLLRRLAAGQGPLDHGSFDAAITGIDHAVGRCSQILLRMQAFAAGGALVRIPQDLRNIVDSAMRIISRTPNYELATIEIRIGSDAEAVLCDPVQIEQVITNLVCNAIEAASGESSPWIGITTLPLGDQIEVVIEDNGPGLPEGEEEALFQPFRTSKPHDGGLGLPISRSIVESHGGRIWCENAPGGGGAVFHFTLPAAPRGPAS
jgi:two-component system sensor kinase FixL